MTFEKHKYFSNDIRTNGTWTNIVERNDVLEIK